MMLKKVMFCGLLFFLLSADVFADQAEWIDKSDAYKAAQMINPGMVLRKYCMPCGDSAWTELAVRQVKVRNVNAQNYEVSVNGKGIDLAYTYIEKEGKWTNLAMLVGLEVSGAPEFLGENKTPAQENKIHPTDKFLEECMVKDSTTMGMMDCIKEAYKLWDTELNKVYKQLRSVLNPTQKKDLKTAQLKWIKYRDSEFKLIDSIYSSFEGTMYMPMNAGERMKIVKKRTLELRAYLDLIKDH
ncbi:DUF1311 domain-containing protein [Desulfobacterales bacterium HSG2]|nr:DUF1311 domain-containing protein [Desulfobacterales bacterium HSG2]